MRNPYYIAFCLFLFASTSLRAQFYNGTAQDFTVSKLQYKIQEWRNYELKKYRVHFYGFNGADKVAESIAIAADSSIKRIERFFDTRLDAPVDIILYNTYHDYLHSNINSSFSREINVGGTAPIERFRVVLYANGNHNDMLRQLNEGLAGVVVNNIFFGGNWKDALKNSTLLDLPTWYIEGLKSYLASEWTNDIDNKVRIGVLNGKYKKVNQLKGDDAKYAGHAIWKFIADNYGENVLPNIVYLTRISSNIESGFAYVLGSNIPKLTTDYFNYFTRRYANEAFAMNEIRHEKMDIKLNKKETLLCFLPSPDGKMAAAVLRREGKFKVELMDLMNKSSKKVFSSGYKYVQLNNDYAPVIAWHPSSQTVSLFYNSKEEVIMEVMDLKGKSDKKSLPEIEEVVNASYSPDGRQLALSAMVGAQSDIYIYTPMGNSMINLTADIYTDLNPSFSNDGETIMFSSNRSHKLSYDIFEISKQGRDLTQVTFTPNINELMPFAYGKEITFIADNNGIYNRFYARKDSSILSVDTIINYNYFTVITPLSNLPFSIENYAAMQNGQYMMQVTTKEKIEFYLVEKEKDVALTNEELLNTTHKNLLLNPKTIKRIGDKKQTTTQPTPDGKITYEKEVVNLSETETKNKAEEKAKTTSTKPVATTPSLQIPGAQFYERDMMITHLVSQLDNSFLNPSYQYYNPKGYFNPGLNTTIRIKLQDVFDNYSFEGGLRLPFNFNSSEYMFRYEDKKHKINKGFNAYRSSIKDVISFPNFQELLSRTHMYEFNVWAAKPLSLISEVRLQGGFRYQSQANLGRVSGSTIFPDETINIPTRFDYLGIVRAFYTINNSYSPELNTRYGFRVKVFGELYNDITNLSSRTIVAGTDIRHYTKVHKGIVWANRFSFSTSLGSQKMLFYLGGVDNWLFPKFNNNIARPEDTPLAFHTLAAPMRGFIQNSRNGNSFAVFSSEFRVPLFSYFSPEPLRSDFLHNFQVIGFTDMGTAWTGFNPYDNTNAFNVKIIEEKNLIIRIQNNQEPIVYAYGFGLRSKLFGYYVRMDWSYGIDDGRVSSIKYVSLSLDF